MKFVKQGLCLGLVAAGLSVVPMMQAQAGAPSAAATDQSIVDRMRGEADGTVRISRETATGKVGFARATEDLLPTRAADSAAGAAAKADAYLEEYGAAFGAAEGQLVRDKVAANDLGWTVTYVQRYRGLDVFGAMIRANLDADGNLTAVNGYAAPDLDLSVEPARSASEAAKAAIAAVRAEPPGENGKADTTGIRATDNELVVYRTGSPRGDVGEAVLTYAVEVGNGANIRDVVFVDADTGKLVNRYSLIHDALYRELYEGSGTQEAPVITKVWEEGQSTAALNPEQLNLVNATGESYWFFANAFGRDSYDDAGARMRTVNNDPRINCPNANWNGVTTNYCNGVTSDDVVAHEWGHAYTEYTWDGIYQWQPGALNEAYSDIWGETVDLINGRQDEGEGDITVKRTSDLCATDGPRAVQLVINDPATIRKVCLAGAASWGALPTTTGITSDIVLALDPADTAGPSTTDGCSPLTNAAAMDGKIGIVYRGTCPFTQKAQNLDAAGATAVVIGNNNNGGPFAPGGTLAPPLDIPVIGISQADADRVVGGLATGPVNTTVRLSGTSETVDSFRWLVGEKSTAFGGAIRDMWAPTCAGDPGKVTDAEYVCGTDDGGGVHSNSGVPNHGYALLVDGGIYNGVTVTGIGLDKAAAIYWRAGAVYQTPTTDFTDHADAITQSCSDLVGEDVLELTTATNAPPVVAGQVSADDCTQVASVIAAVELRTEPVQCNFQPLLKPGAPKLECGQGFNTRTLFIEDFEGGLAGWTSESEIVYTGGSSLPWQATSSAPGNHPGGVARGVGTGEGACVGGPGDYSSRDSIISPTVTVPPAAKSPRMTFDHYVATEAEYDGGNVKVSINKGAFTVIPTSAYTFNQPNDTISPTSPLAGQDAFSGTDGGEVGGTWGQSQVDLAQLGLKTGDQLRFRFDMGRDGCGGNDGWYVDNVTVETCLPKGNPPVPPVPPGDKVDSDTKLKIKPKNLEHKENFKAKIKVKAEDVEPSGKVKLYADGKKIGKGKLNSAGKLVIKVTKNLKAGKWKMVAKYVGSDTVKKSKDKVMVRIKR